MRPNQRRGTFLLIIGLLFGVFSAAYGQYTSGTISGTVHDSSGAVVPNATVTVTNTDRNQTVRTISTDANGFYTAPRLPIGHYIVSASAPGFQQQDVKNIDLHVGDTLNISPTLQVGNTSQTVTVNATAFQVNTENASNSTLISATQIAQLPLNTRNYEQLVQLQPGISYGGGDQLYIGLSNPSGQTNTVSFSINGQRNSANNWTVDGADNMDRGSNLTLLVYPSVDAIAEFRTFRNTYSAEFGRSASGQIDVITKSGTHDFHGSAYEFFRNDVLNANSFFTNYVNKPRPPFRYNDFGYSIGGPVWIPHVYNSERNKTFFFFSQEVRRVITYSPLTLSGDPTAEERQGTFPHPVCTTASGCSTGSTQVPITSPTVQAYLKDLYSKIPLPNSPSDPNGLIVTERNVYNGNQQIVRIDHNFTSKFSAFFRFENDSIPTVEPGGLFSGSGFPGVGVTNTNAPGRNYLGHVNYVFSPTLLLDMGYAFSQGAILSDPVGLMAKKNSPDVNPTLPFASTLPRIPSLTFTGGTSLTSYGTYRDYNRDHNVFMNLSKIAGQHSLRFGVVYHHYEKTENSGGSNAGTFNFTNTNAPSSVPKANQPTSFEQSFANFLAGNVASFAQASEDITPDITTNQAEGYAQDDWKVAPRLTLNVGVRYSWFQQPIDNNHELTNFSPMRFVPGNAPTIDNTGSICTTAPCAGGGAPNPNYDPLNGILVANVSSPYGSKVAPQKWLNFAPRVGFALDVFGDGKTSLRGGYGIAYDSSLFGIYEQNIFQNPPYVNSVTIPNASIDSPASGTPKLSSLPKALRGTPYQEDIPYAQQFSLGIQQQVMPNFIFEMDYVGSLGRHLLGIADINQPLPGAYVAAGIASPGGITSANTKLLNQIRPYKGYDAINQVETWFTSNYHSLQTSIQKRFHDGSLIEANYTFAKALTNAGSDRSNAPQNTYNIAAEYSRASLDRRNVFTADFVYALPFFRNQSGFTGHVLGGWQLVGLVLANSGLPATARTSQDPAGLGLVDSASVAGARPNQISNPNIGAPHKLLLFFNSAAFVNVPAGVATVGSARPFTINGPGFQRWDLALHKTFAFTETTGLQFRAESFNTFNHTNFDSISTSLTAGNYGQVTATRDPRIMQLALKFTF